MSHKNQKQKRNDKKTQLNQECSFLMGSKKVNNSIYSIHDQFLTSQNVYKKRQKDESVGKPLIFQKPCNVAATDQSSNNQQSNYQQSIEIHPPQFPNEPYLQPISFTQKKPLPNIRRRQGDFSRLNKVSAKVIELSKMVRSQGKQIHFLKSSLSEKELHRLLKIHSTQKLKLVNELTYLSTSKDKKKALNI